MSAPPVVAPPAAELVGHFSIEPFGGHVWKVADLGQPHGLSLLMLQTAGQLACAMYLDQARLGLHPDDQKLHCLTAVSLAGDVLWQVGEPWQRTDPYVSHGGSNMIVVDDVDGDGEPEVLVVHGGELSVLNAATGATKATRPLPADNFVQMTTAKLTAGDAQRQIICKVNDAAYEGWQYANPTVIYNADLSVYAEPFAVRGAGHNVVALDLRGTGRDDLFIGYSRFDADLNEQWRLDLGEGFDYAKEHADQIVVADVDGDGQLEVRYAGSDDFYVVDLDGNMKWTSPAGHSQTSVQGAWGPAGEQRIIMNEKNLGVSGLDPQGAILWTRRDINGYATADVRWLRDGPRTTWPLFRPQLKPVTPPTTSDPADSRTLWPRFLDGDGTTHDVLPWDDAYAQPKRHIRAKRSYDCGVLYEPKAVDLDGDGLDEIVVADRSHVWLFKSPGR